MLGWCEGFSAHESLENDGQFIVLLMYGIWRSPVARFVRDEEVASSNLAIPTSFLWFMVGGFTGGDCVME